MKKIFALLLALCLLMSAACFAEEAAPAIDLTDMTVTFPDGASYAFPMSVKDAEAAGIHISSDVYSLEKGYSYTLFTSDRVGDEDAYNEFVANVVYNQDTPDTPWINGVTLRVSGNSGAVLGGVVIGETTKGEVVAALGADRRGNTDGNSLTYYLYGMNIRATFDFYDDSDSAQVTSLQLQNAYVENFGTEFNPAAPAADLPDASALQFNQVIVGGQLYTGEATLQDYLNNGWKLEGRYDPLQEVDGRRDNTMYGFNVLLYNGEHLIQAGVYNESEEPAALIDCNVTQLTLKAELGANCVTLAKGLNIGSTYDEVIAALGEPRVISEGAEGCMRLNYNLVVMDAYTWIVEIDPVTNTVISLMASL